MNGNKSFCRLQPCILSKNETPEFLQLELFVAALVIKSAAISAVGQHLTTTLPFFCTVRMK